MKELRAFLRIVKHLIIQILFLMPIYSQADDCEIKNSSYNLNFQKMDVADDFMILTDPVEFHKGVVFASNNQLMYLREDGQLKINNQPTEAMIKGLVVKNNKIYIQTMDEKNIEGGGLAKVKQTQYIYIPYGKDGNDGERLLRDKHEDFPKINFPPLDTDANKMSELKGSSIKAKLESNYFEGAAIIYDDKGKEIAHCEVPDIDEGTRAANYKGGWLVLTDYGLYKVNISKNDEKGTSSGANPVQKNEISKKSQ